MEIELCKISHKSYILKADFSRHNKLSCLIHIVYPQRCLSDSLDQIRFQRRKENNKTQIFDLTLQATYFVDNNKILNFLNKIPRKNSLFKKNLFDINPIRTSTFLLLCEKSSNYALWSLPFANKKFFLGNFRIVFHYAVDF